MAGRTMRLLHPMRGGRAALGVVRALQRRDVVQYSASVKCFERGHGKTTHTERKTLQGGSGIFGLLQHQDREIGEAQLTGEKQADGSGTGNDDVIGSGVTGGHERTPLSVFDRSGSSA